MKVLFYWPMLIFLMIAAVGLYFTVNFFSYWQPLDKCYVGVQGNYLKGNKETIFDALKNMRKSNIDDYFTVCRNVNMIVEGQCPRFQGDVLRDSADNCFVSGSKTIFIAPDQGSSEESMKKREAEIVRLSKLSKSFWLRESQRK